MIARTSFARQSGVETAIREGGPVDERERIEIPPARGRLVLLLVIGTTWLAGSIFLLPTSSAAELAFSALAVCFPLALAGTAMHALVTKRRLVHIDRDGIVSGSQRILWPEVGAVTTRSPLRAHVVYVGRTIEGERRYRTQLSPLRRAIEPADRQVFHAITIHVSRRGQLDADGLAQWITRIRDQTVSVRPLSR